MIYGSTNKSIAQESDVTLNSKSEQKDDDKFPFPKGGMSGFYQYLADELKYPETAKQDSIQGKVLVRFVVSPKGKIKRVKVIDGIREDVNLEAKRVFETMPYWEPGTNGIGIKLIVPVIFSME